LFCFLTRKRKKLLNGCIFEDWIREVLVEFIVVSDIGFGRVGDGIMNGTVKFIEVGDEIKGDKVVIGDRIGC
jgi:hypothetical protein